MDYNEVINSEPVVLVEFYASWCPHCQRMMPIVEQVRELLEGRATVHQFDIDENQALAAEAGVESIPTFLVYKNGREVWRHSGEIPGEVLLQAVQNYL